MVANTDVRLAQRGDKEAFSRLVRALELPMYRIARSIVGTDEDCADAIQESILKAYQSLAQLKKPLYFKTWFLRILINECNLILRRRKRTMPVAVLPDEQQITAEYAKVDIWEAVGRLEESLRLVVRLHYMEDFPVGVIAELLDLPEGTVKSRLYRARLQLAEWFDNPNEGKIGYETC